MILNQFQRGYFSGGTIVIIGVMIMLFFRYNESLIEVFSFGIGYLVPILLFIIFLILLNKEQPK